MRQPVRRSFRLVAGVVAVLGIPSGAGAGIDSDVATPHPDAPPETAQFGFLIGRWDCAMRTMSPDGTSWTESRATWSGYYILGGWAIQDVWESSLPGGGLFFGTNVRSFNPTERKWDNHWLPSGSLEWKYYEAEKVGETMVMTGGEGVDGTGRAFVDRNVFYDVGADLWRWRKDRSFDGGNTWIEGVAFIEARRARASP